MVWDKYANAGATFQKWQEPGDQVIGVVKQIREGKDFDKNPVPEIVLDDGEGGSVVVTASLTMLRAELVAAAPNVGDRVRITFTGLGEARNGRQAPKLFTVEVKPTGASEQAQLEAPF